MTFREIIQPEAVTMDFLMTQDIKLNMLHDRKQTVARWNKGKGSLRLTLTSEGLDFEFDAPKCDLGDRCLEMVRRGDYSGCSFEFYPKDYDVVERGNGKKDVLVKHRSFAKLTALTIGLDPAYTATSVNARELYEKTEAGKAEKQAEIEKAEREAAEAAERERIEEEERERILREQRRRAKRRRLSERDIENFSY
jgi:phage head maturation protease